LLEDGTRRRQMGQDARAWVEAEFSLARLVEKTACVYQDALDSLDAAAGGRNGK